MGFFVILCSMKHSNCYMVWGGDLESNHQTRFSQEDMVIGCLVDLATGLMTFAANGKEINTFYQVSTEGLLVISFVHFTPVKLDVICFRWNLTPSSSLLCLSNP